MDAAGITKIALIAPICPIFESEPLSLPNGLIQAVERAIRKNNFLFLQSREMLREQKHH